MRLISADFSQQKGWYTGAWDSALALSIGYANAGIDEPHVHQHITEIYLVASGIAEIRVGQMTVLLRAGNVLILGPGEAHTFLSSSPDYFHFVLHTPGLSGEAASADKMPVSRARLGLPDGDL
jgi:mannose-6-phosphate isomerase-like protein (cupin superfamily)